MSKILITGGTGNLGKSLVKILEEKKVKHTIASRQNKTGHVNIAVMDLLKDKGVREAVSGKEIIFHLATDLKHDTRVTQNLLNAIDPDSHVHLIYISIVGTDKVPLAYYRQKLASEEAVKRSGIPYTILRATQFHEFVDQVLRGLLKYPIGLVPKKILLQPIDTTSVAEKLYRLSLDGAPNKTYEIGGAEVHTLEALAKQWMVQKNKKSRVINLPILGKLGRSLRNGRLTTPNSKKQSISWKQWLAKTAK